MHCLGCVTLDSLFAVTQCTSLKRNTQMVREEGVSSLSRGIGPNVFRAVLMNASQLAS
jgi:hypothetical protein